MKRIVLAAVALALFASCKEKTCPTCEKCPPPPAPCPEPACDVSFDDAGKTGVAPRFVFVQDEKTGKAFVTATLPDKRVIAVPLSATTEVYVDGKSTKGEVLLGRGGGSCPCQLIQCMPYCRPIGELLTTTQPAPTPPQ